MLEPAVAAWNTSEEKIRKAIKKKRPQGRKVESPSILALYANGISTTFEDFDHALYGRKIGVLGTETPTGLSTSWGVSFTPTAYSIRKRETRHGQLCSRSSTCIWAADPTPTSTSTPASREICRRRSRVSSAGASIPVAGSVNAVPSGGPGFMKGLCFLSV
jgi:hypothetical protein